MTAAANIKAGSRILASQIVNVAPLAAYKSVDQSVTSSTTLVNDNTLFIPVLASATYDFKLFLNYEGSTQGASDLKFAWTGPTGFGMQYQLNGIQTTGAWTSGFLRGISGGTLGTNGAGNKFAATMIGTVTTSTTPGTLQFQWAQNTSSGTATIVHATSDLAAWQIA